MSNNTIFQSGDKNKATIHSAAGKGVGFWLSIIAGLVVTVGGGVAVGYILFTQNWN